MDTNILEQNKHKRSVNKDLYYGINLNNNVRVIPTHDISDTINTYKVFDKERNECTKYRLNLTINPICTNVLANPITQVFDGTTEITGTSRFNAIKTINQDYTYRFGYDIFDNHYFRADMFKTGSTLNDFTGSTMFDVLTFRNSIRNNLVEENGWFGFINKSKVTGDIFLNSKSACDHIDLFPDRTYFSFNEEYNELTSEMEDNWDYCLTYPYENKTDDTLVTDNGINGIPIHSSTAETISNKTYLKIVTPYKHGLKSGDIIKIKRNGTNSNKTYLVYDTGNVQKEYNDNVFLLDTSKYTDLLTITGITQSRVVKVINKVDCNYYIRKFRKIPNFKNEINVNESNIIEKTVTNNTNFLNEKYELGFSKNIYGDKITQIQYIDGVDMKLLKDNLGRPLTEMYFTIIKKNQLSSPNERSNVFGNLISGINSPIPISQYHNIRGFEESYLLTEDNGYLLMEDGGLSELDLISEYSPIESNITISGASLDNIFIGDIVEYNKSTFKEVILDEIHYRFNTNQRESSSNQMTYHVTNGNSFKTETISLPAYKEGYFYKPHNKIYLKNYSSVLERGELSEINRCTTCAVSGITFNNVYTAITGQSHTEIKYIVVRVIDYSKYQNLNKVRVIRNSDDKFINTILLLRGDIQTSVLIPYDYSFMGDVNTLDLSGFKLKKYSSEDIPDYAEDLGDGRCVWRKILPEGVFDEDSRTTTELQYLNGHFYVNKSINFLLKRQDPFGYYNIRKDIFPSDVQGQYDGVIIENNKTKKVNKIC